MNGRGWGNPEQFGGFLFIMGLNVFLITDYTSTGAISTYLHLQPGLILMCRDFVSGCPVNMCLKAVSMNVVEIPGITCTCVCIAKEAENFHV